MQNKPENTKCYILKSNLHLKFCWQYKSYKQPPLWLLCTFSGAEPHTLTGNVADVFMHACSSSHKNKTAYVGLSILLTKFKAHNGVEQVLHDVEFFRIFVSQTWLEYIYKGFRFGFSQDRKQETRQKWSVESKPDYFSKLCQSNVLLIIRTGYCSNNISDTTPYILFFFFTIIM